jgi:NADH:ubiquinone oxidoreductase subunit 6 (subunit J)
MTYQSKDYESAKRSLTRKLLPGIVILVILAICILLMMARNNAPVPPAQTQKGAVPR